MNPECFGIGEGSEQIEDCDKCGVQDACMEALANRMEDLPVLTEGKPACFGDGVAWQDASCSNCAMEALCKETILRKLTDKTKPILKKKPEKAKNSGKLAILKKWQGKKVLVFDRYLFAVPVVGRVIGLSEKDNALQINFDSGNPGGPNVTKHNGEFFHSEQCRLVPDQTDMVRKAELIEEIIGILDSDTLTYLTENVDKLSSAGLVALHNVLFGSTFMTEHLEDWELCQYGYETEGVYSGTDEEIEESIKEELRNVSRRQLLNIHASMGLGIVEEARVIWHHH